jgi:GNAT superfamily N-acetyltransferase
MGYTYRTANNSDIEQLQALRQASYGPFKRFFSDEHWEKFEEGFKHDGVEELLSRAVCFVCEDDSQIVGMAFLFLSGNPFWLFPADWSYIRYVGVYPQHEGKGIGRKLTRLCIDEAKSRGEKTVALHTSELQNAARHIYESMGFVQQQAVLLFNIQYWIYTLNIDQNESAVS